MLSCLPSQDWIKSILCNLTAVSLLDLSLSLHHPTHMSARSPILNILPGRNFYHSHIPHNTHTHPHTIQLNLYGFPWAWFILLCVFFSVCLFSVQACECLAVWWRWSSIGCSKLHHCLPASVLAVPVVALECLPPGKLHRTSREERYDRKQSMTWKQPRFGFSKI